MCIRGRFIPILCVVLFLFVGACASSDPKKRKFPQDYSAEEVQKMGIRLLGAGDTTKALKYLTLAEEKGPKNPVTQYYLGLAYNARGLKDKAMEHFQKALELKEDYPEVYNAVGALYADQGRFSEAEKAFRTALSYPLYDTPHLTLFNLGRLYEKRGDSQKALSLYREALRLQSNYAVAYFRMGRLLEAMGNRPEAQKAYGEAIRFDPNMADAQFHFGRLCYLMGDRESAIVSLSQVLILEPRSSLAKAAREYLQKLEGESPGSNQYKYPYPYESPYQYEYPQQQQYPYQ
jgi:Tfp pilus assembly protein PilF